MRMDRSGIVGALAMFAQIEAFTFDVGAHPQTRNGLGDEDGDGSTDRCPDDGGADRKQLDHDFLSHQIWPP